jgi:hypothetical protein
LKGLKFTGVNVLRRLTFRISFRGAPTDSLDVLLGALSTVTSPALCEFVLDVRRIPPPNLTPSSAGWEELNKLLEERFAEREGFKLVIKTGNVYGAGTFQQYMGKGFPLLTRRGYIHLKMPHD